MSESEWGIIMEYLIREEAKEDFYASELITKRAFWNKHIPGCDEHYLVHILREDTSYIKELTRVAVADGKVVGLIMYTHAMLKKEVEEIPVITFGPLCVDPEYQGLGIGGDLLETTLKLAKEMGYKGVIIYGEPDYYPLHGFMTCDHWGITTPDGKNFDAFMGIELVDGYLNHPGAKFYEASVYENIEKDKVGEYDKKFPYMEKLKLPGQWE